jgi:hypothetical protein
LGRTEGATASPGPSEGRHSASTSSPEAEDVGGWPESHHRSDEEALGRIQEGAKAGCGKEVSPEKRKGKEGAHDRGREGIEESNRECWRQASEGSDRRS